MVIKTLLSLSVLTTVVFFGSAVSADEKEEEGAVIYQMKANDAQLIRYLTGDVRESIRGVPAIPVDSFDWSGGNIVKIGGHAKLDIDPINNTGSIRAFWHDEYGHWIYEQTMFVAPPHPTGVKVGPSVSQIIKITDDPVTTDVYLHGDTGAGAPVIPTVFNLLATWGPAKVKLNGEIFPNTFDGMKMWMGHTMISEGVRDDDGAVTTTSGEIYDMSKREIGVTYPDKLAFHIVFHSMPGEDMISGNVPPPVGFFYHISFSAVKLKIKHEP